MFDNLLFIYFFYFFCFEKKKNEIQSPWIVDVNDRRLNFFETKWVANGSHWVESVAIL